MVSNQKPVIVRRFSRDWLPGYANLRNLGHDGVLEILDTGVGFSRVAFTIREDMLNAHNTAHGGYVFALADSAFAYACNSRNQSNLALQCSISFAAPALEGMRLIATARERARGGRTGTYDIEVTNEAGDVIAFFRGTSYRVASSIV